MNITLGAGDEEKGQPVLGLAFEGDMGGSGQGARGAAGLGSVALTTELVARTVAARADDAVNPLPGFELPPFTGIFG